jgi:hypothetical protein
MANAAGSPLYVRLSLARPKAGNESGVARIEEDLMAFFAKQPGYLHGYQIVGGDSEGRVGRLTLWESGQHADQAAQTEHVLAQRSELLMLIEDETHVEDSWVAHEVEAAAS